jgi:hypothetical protein
MGSLMEMNDTLQITIEQGFPKKLNFAKHKIKPFKAEKFNSKIYKFKKDGIRMYQQPPIRNFLVQNIKGQWLYWGLVNIIETIHDDIKQTTSGKFRITYIYTPEEMKMAHQMIDRKNSTDYFKNIK